MKVGNKNWENWDGYILFTLPNHPLSMKDGTIYEHRYVAYEQYGETLPNCEMCDKPLTWSTCHIDHINEVKSDNSPENLRPLCPICNRGRGLNKAIATMKERYGTFLEMWGERKTIRDWSRDDRISVSDFCIGKRLKDGWSVEDALLKPSQRGKNTKGIIIGKSIENHGFGYVFFTPLECEQYGFRSKNISACVTGRRPHHKGFEFIRI